VLFAQFGVDTYLLFGLGDGQLVNYRCAGRQSAVPCGICAALPVPRSTLGGTGLPTNCYGSSPLVSLDPLLSPPTLSICLCLRLFTCAADWTLMAPQTARRLHWAQSQSPYGPSGAVVSQTFHLLHFCN
jgi:hypothetical protein